MRTINSRSQHLDLAPIYRNFVGFDHLATMLEDISGSSSDSSYPPFNLIQADENSFRIELAIAGFDKSDIDIEAENRRLTVRGAQKEKSDNSEGYLHRGIATRAFERSFHLADNVEVIGADIENGMLVIRLERIIPEELKPRKIEIGKSSKRINK